MAREIAKIYKERRNGPNYKPQRDALDDLLSFTRKEKEAQKKPINSESEMSDVEKSAKKNVYDYSSDSSGQGTRFSKRTGIFEIDFPDTPNVSKIDAKHPKKSSKSYKEGETSKNSSKTTKVYSSDSEPAIPPSGRVTRNLGGDVSENPSNTDDDMENNVNTVRGRFSQKKGKKFEISIFCPEIFHNFQL